MCCICRTVRLLLTFYPESLCLLDGCWVKYLHQYQHVNNGSVCLFTLTLSKLSGQVEDARRPSLFSFLQISSPSVSRSTMKQVMPLYPCQSTRAELFLFIAKQLLMKVEMRHFYIKIQLQKYEKWVMTGHKIQKKLGLLTADKSTLAITRKTPACSALLIHILDPLMM